MGAGTLVATNRSSNSGEREEEIKYLAEVLVFPE